MTHASALDLVTYTGSLSKSASKSFSTSDITKLFSDSRTAATSETLDVTSGLTDGFGAALAFSTVKAVLIQNKSSTATLTVGGSSNPLFNQLPVIQAGGFVAFSCSITTSGSVKNVLLTASASLDYDIVIVGS